MAETLPSLLSETANPWRQAEGKDEGAMWLAWLVRLRWVAIVGQIVTLSFTFAVIDRPWVVVPGLLCLVAALVAANAWALRRLQDDAPVTPEVLLLHLVIDVTVLTAFFAASGGPANPFVMLYVVHVAMAAVMMRPDQALLLAVLVITANALLHWVHLPLHPDRHTFGSQALLSLGQVVALSVTVLSVGAFVLGMAATLRRQKQRLLEARERTAQTDRLRAVGTLAAGAAHELNTPLSTMDLRIRRISRRHPDDDTQADLDVVRAQLERCTDIVEQLLLSAGDPSAGGFERRALQGFVHDALKLWTKGSPIDVVLRVAEDPIVVELPSVAFTTAFINLLENAREAQEEVGVADALEVRVRREGRYGAVDILDQGRGLPSEVDRVGEPFFTTKAAGTGLGVFVARALADGAGGGLSYARADGRTITHWTFPESARTP